MHEEMPQSMLQFVFHALGVRYTLLLPAAGLFTFILTLILVIRGRGPWSTTAVLLIVPMPLLIGIFGALEGAVAGLQVIASSPTAPRPSELATVYGTALISPVVGALLMAPSYLLASAGAFVRAMLDRGPPPPPPHKNG